MSSQVIYLAGPYYYSPEAAFEQHMRYAAVLFGSNLHVFSPILHCHALAHTYSLPKDYTFWKEYNKNMVIRCDEVWVISELDWRKSQGTLYEIDVAYEYDMPVKLITLNDNKFRIKEFPL